MYFCITIPLFLIILVVSSFNGGDARFGHQHRSFTCVVTGDVLFINGVKDRILSAKELEEYNNYTADVHDYNVKVKEHFQQNSNRCFYGSCCYGCVNAAQPTKNQSNTGQNNQMPQYPQTPSFCNPENVKIYKFDACQVQNDKVYVGLQYARDLTLLEIEKFQVYDRDLKEFWENVTATNQQQAPYGTQNWQVHKQAPITDQQPTLQMPTPPNICNFIYV
uniref:Pepsin inhibitor-3-like repeated domain-containing protein n=1 Tax=Acrobeloides nanus TaxID=290746 RepID=A0A914CC56_9BILA